MIRLMDKPCTGCGGPRDWTRRNAKGEMIAVAVCRKCHSLQSAAWVEAKPERKERKRVLHLKWYHIHRTPELLAYKRMLWQKNKERYRYRQPTTMVESVPVQALIRLSGDKLLRAIEQLRKDAA